MLKPVFMINAPQSTQNNAEVAQSVEKRAVNHWVRGSSPCWGAKQNQGVTINHKPFFDYKYFDFQPYFQPSREIKNRPKPVVLLL